MTTTIFIIVLVIMYALAACMIISGIMALQHVSGIPKGQNKLANRFAIISGIFWPISAIELIIRTIRNKPSKWEQDKIKEATKKYSTRLEEIMKLPDNKN